jgi:hypothetical protein
MQRVPLSFKERAGVRMGLCRASETHPHLNPPLEGEENLIALIRFVENDLLHY